MVHHIKHWYIPHEANDYRPYGMRHKTLHWITSAVILAKVVVLLWLFLLYPTGAYFSTITSTKIIELSSTKRIETGLPALKENYALSLAASRKLQDMVENNYFAHQSPNGNKAWEWIVEAGYNYTYAGENLAMNFFSAEEVVEAWMKSKTHQENVLSPKYEDIGVAVGQGTINGQSVTLIVQLFGKTYFPLPLQFLKPQSQVLGLVRGIPEVAGGTEAVSITSSAFSLRTLVKNKDVIRFLGVLVLVGLFFLALHEKQHHRLIAHGLLVLVIVIAALVINPHFLEGVTGDLMIF